MKIINIVLAVLFFVFAAVQLNDPDPWLWVLLYSFVGIICGMAAFGKFQPILIGGGLLISLIAMGFYLPSFINWIKDGMPSITGSMKAESLYIELVREFLGLFLGALCLAFQWRSYRKESLSSTT